MGLNCCCSLARGQPSSVAASLAQQRLVLMGLCRRSMCMPLERSETMVLDEDAGLPVKHATWWQLFYLKNTVKKLFFCEFVLVLVFLLCVMISTGKEEMGFLFLEVRDTPTWKKQACVVANSKSLTAAIYSYLTISVSVPHQNYQTYSSESPRPEFVFCCLLVSLLLMNN